MKIQTITMPSPADLQAYLRDAEQAIDAMTDEELDALEADLEIRVKAIANPPAPKLSVVGGSTSRTTRQKSKISRLSWTGATGLLVAAMALLMLRQNDASQDLSGALTKGLVHATVCSVQSVKSGGASAESSDAGYLVTRGAPVYVKSNCEGDLTLESLEAGTWVKQASVTSSEGFLSQSNDLLNLESYIGKTLRIRNEQGVSEEFVLIGTP